MIEKYILALIALVFLAALCAWLGRKAGSHANIASNSQLGVSEHDMGVLPKLADIVFPARYLLVKIGSDYMHVTPCAAAADEPLGVSIDAPYDAGDPTSVRLLNAHKGTQTMVANGAIANGASLYSDGTGKVGIEPNVAGVYWKVGRNVGVASVNSGDYIEVEPCKPVKLVVIAALTSAQIGAAPTQANYNALQADVASIGAALATPALVKVI